MIDATTIQALAGLFAAWVALLGLLAGFSLWHFRDIKEQNSWLDNKIDRTRGELLTEIRRLDDKIDRSQAELREEMRQMEERILRGQAELREEMRRGFAQLLSALNGHTHDPDTGAAVFHEVPTAADDD